MKFDEISLPIRDNSPIEVSIVVRGHRVSLVTHATEVVVADVEGDDVTVAQRKAGELADLFLDMVCAKYEFATMLRPGQATGRSHDGPAGEAKTHLAVQVTVGISAVYNVLTLAPDGTVLSDSNKPGHVALSHSDAMSYFRKARTDSDVFAGLKNYFLAAESAASVLAPEAAKVMKDRATFIEGVRRTYGKNDPSLTEAARRLVPHGIDVSTTEQAASELYGRYRNPLNHAKDGHPRLIPSRATDEAMVRSALPLMKRVARDMILAGLGKADERRTTSVLSNESERRSANDIV